MRFGHGDGSFGHRALDRAFGVAADFHRDIEAGAFFSFSGGLIAAVLVGVKGYPYTLGCFVHLFTKVIHKKPGKNHYTIH